MAFIGGERLFSVPAAVLAAVIGAGVVAVASEPRGVSLASVAQLHQMTTSRDAATGVVTLRGACGVVRLAPGLTIASVNGSPLDMDQPAYVRAGRIYVSGEFADRLSRLLEPPTLLVASPENRDPDDAPVHTAASDPDGSAGVVPTAAAAGWRVVIDAGHGGKFDGAVGPEGLKEKDLTLALSRKLGQRLAAMGVEVVQTRHSDLSLADDWSQDLDLRVAVGERAEPDLFVSLHFNAEESATVQGFEIHLPHGEGGGPSDREVRRVKLDAAREAGLRAAHAIRDALRDALETPDRGVKFGRKRVVFRTAAPAVLLEYAFISHPLAERRYRNPGAIDVLADATARGIRHYLASVRPRRR